MAEKRSRPDTAPLRGPVEGALAKVLRALFGVLIHLIYRIRVIGQTNVPAKGPALLVCNHVSWLDAIFIGLTLRRPVRFLVWAPFTKVPFLRRILWLYRAIPISAESGRRAIVDALRQASEALARGELVGIFAEGSITRTGFMLPFHRGLEQILKKTAVPIIPTCLDRLWGSIFSYQGGRIFWKWPQQIPYPVTLSFGEPLPPDTKAWQVRQTVQQLLADCFNLRKDAHQPAHRQFVRMACKHPFRSCLIEPNKRELNYGQTLTAAILLSRALRTRLHNEPMAGLLLPTTVGGALANIAVALLGKTAVNLNYTASRESVLSALRQCHLRQVISARRFLDKIHLDLGPEVEVIDLEEIAGRLTTAKFQKLRTFLGILLLPAFWTERITLGLGKHKSSDLATIIFSSGSTGDAKGVMLSQHNVVSNTESVSQAVDLSPADRLLGVLPFFHSFGYTVGLWLPLLVGASIVYYPDPRQAKEIGEFCRQYRCTLFLSTPTFLRFLVRRCEKDDFRTVRLLITGAEKLPRTLALEFQEKFSVAPLEGYGCTELSPVACANVPDWEENGHRQIGSKPGTIGQPIPGVAAKIVDPNTFETLPPGAAGLLLIYGPNVMVGYLDRPEATREAIRDGWYVTGDIAKLDDEGFLTITDRLSRFSKIGGEMVPHMRVEEEIHAILQTTDRLCAVTGVPDDRKGERLVVLHTSLNGLRLQEIHEKLGDSGLPNLWLPSPRSYFEVPELPVLGSGKLDLQRVKKLALELATKAGE